MSDAMRTTARELVAPGKGILAADESTGTIKKRFDPIGVESTEETRRRYRQMLFTTSGIGDHISGVILYDETIRQASDDGVPFVKVLEAAGSIPGIKVDLGAKPLAFYPNETVTEGLDGLRERLAEYRTLGARFAKWRAPLPVGDGLPSEYSVVANMHAMARYAALCQEAEIVPIVEPEILMDGDHSLEGCEEATGRTLGELYRQLAAARVDLPGTLLKVNMIVPGKASSAQGSDVEIAEATVRCLLAHVPPDVPGVVFLSGGMSDVEATNRLNEMNRIAASRGGLPWELSFSYGRALQAPSLEAWGGRSRERGGRPGRPRPPGDDERPGSERRVRPVHGAGGLARSAPVGEAEGVELGEQGHRAERRELLARPCEDGARFVGAAEQTQAARTAHQALAGLEGEPERLPAVRHQAVAVLGPHRRTASLVEHGDRRVVGEATPLDRRSRVRRHDPFGRLQVTARDRDPREDRQEMHPDLGHVGHRLVELLDLRQRRGRVSLCERHHRADRGDRGLELRVLEQLRTLRQLRQRIGGALASRRGARSPRRSRTSPTCRSATVRAPPSHASISSARNRTWSHSPRSKQDSSSAARPHISVTEKPRAPANACTSRAISRAAAGPSRNHVRYARFPSVAPNTSARSASFARRIASRRSSIPPRSPRSARTLPRYWSASTTASFGSSSTATSSVRSAHRSARS